MKKNKFNLQFFGMTNPDLLQQKKAEIMVKMNQAMKDGNDEAFAQAFTEYTDMLQEAVMAEARGFAQSADNQILTGRGVRVLTSEEEKYYQKLIKAMQTGTAPALDLIDETLPKTVIDAIFEDITENHPLLNAISFQNTGILAEILVSKIDGRFLAHWGKLCSEITEKLGAGFEVINLRQAKLSAYIPICKAMLDIGPEWIDRYVRTILAEAIANGLEKAIIDGTGVNEPVGMRRNPEGSFHPTNGYPVLTPIPFKEINPESYGGIIAGLAKGPNDLYRTVTEVLLVVNPVDYFTKLMPSTTMLVNGQYVNNVFPFPTRVVQSVWVTQGEAILGLAKRYFFGLGTGKEGKIEYSDDYKFLEDERVYLTKLYGTGKPLDNKSFLLLDISDLSPTFPVVRVTDYADARLKTLTGKDKKNANLGIVFNENIRYYGVDVADVDAADDNNQVVLTVAAKEDAASIVVLKNGAATGVTDNKDGTWTIALSDGANVLGITSSINAEAEAYVLVVSYTPKEV